MVKQDRARRTHELVLDAAAAEFATHGFAGTNLQSVAERTGLTKGALYGHFGSKAELAAELTRQFGERWQELLHTARSTEDSPLPSLHTLVTEVFRRTQQEGRFAAGLRLVVEEARAKGVRPPHLEQLRLLLLALVERGQEHGEIDAGRAPEVLSQLLLAAVYGLHHTAPVARAEHVREMWDILLPGMRHPAD
ncbi:TetR family transcriptional regulator [Streptomyces sp. NPDC058272]|uniref:TetR family transcriptional regulator n=1 Tax=Streptomyces sp. NPDC058272 TaxID=3346415 RepID=UPI0036E78EF0